MLDFRISYQSKAGFQKHIISIENWISETHITSKTHYSEPPSIHPWSRLDHHHIARTIAPIAQAKKNTKNKTYPKPWPHPIPVVRASPLPSIPRRPLPSPPFDISPIPATIPSIRIRELPSPNLLDLPISLPTRRTAATPTHIRTDVMAAARHSRNSNRLSTDSGQIVPMILLVVV